MSNTVIVSRQKQVQPARELAKKVIKYRNMYLFLLPALVLVYLFRYRPMIGVVIAFQDFDIIKGYASSPFVGLKHFKAFLQSPDFYRALKNTLGINCLSLVFGFPLPIIFALLVNEIKNAKFKRITQTITYLPHFISWIVISSMVYKMLDQNTGVVNDIIEFFGGERIGFMRESRYFWGIFVSVSIWKELGWNSIIYLAAMAGIDPELYEAAMVDGASRFKRVIYITIPCIAPTIGLMLILAMGHIVSGGGFSAIYNMQNPMVADVAEILETYSMKEGVFWGKYSYATAIGLTQSVVSFILVFLANSISRRLSGYGAF